MKNMILVVCITMSMLLQVNAQNNNDDSDNKLKFGVKAGLNIANASGNGVDLFTENKSSLSRLGVSIGTLVEYKISDKFSVQPELYYSQQGFKTDISDGIVKLDYINIPVLAKYYISDAFSLEVGPQIGFLLSFKYSYSGQEQVASKAPDSKVKQAILDTDEDLKEYFKSTDFGLNFGLSYQLNNGFGINARYYLGLKDIFDYSTTNTDVVVVSANSKAKKAAIQSDGDYVIKNRFFQVGVFYTF